MNAAVPRRKQDQNLQLVNAWYPVQGEPSASMLEPVLDEFPSVLLVAEAARCLRLLLRRVGESRIVLVSGFRSQQEQRQVWKDSLCENGSALTAQYVARPGTSEHQTGLAIDLAEKRAVIDNIRPAFPDTGVCAAFRRLAAAYGFIERYPVGAEKITGIAAEPWHYRFVGAPHARLLARHGGTLEQYLEWLRGYTEARPLRRRILCRDYTIFTAEDCEWERLVSALPADTSVQASYGGPFGPVITWVRDAQ